MAILKFPPVETASAEGLLAIGGDLEIDSLLLAYKSGIFPWPTEDFPLLWFAPPRRAILEFSRLKIPARFNRELKKMSFHYQVDKNFSAVIRGCAQGKTRKSKGTWITPAMIKAYTNFHQAGYAHSFECYNDKNQLVGGLYGVAMGGFFAGESMFYHETGASKAALIFAAQTLEEKGAPWMDVQLLTPLLTGFGAREIPREEYMRKLQIALKNPPLF